MLKKVSGDTNTPSEIHDVRIDYKLYAVGDPSKPKVSSSVKASSGGGFGFKSALKLAYFAGSMYFTMGMGGGMNMMSMMGQGAGRSGRNDGRADEPGDGRGDVDHVGRERNAACPEPRQSEGSAKRPSKPYRTGS